jgi:hypothetical protein
VVTYRHATRPSSSEHTVVTRSPTSRAPSRTVVSQPVSSPQPGPAVTAPGPSDAAKRWAELMGRGGGAPGSQPEQPVPPQAMDAPPGEGTASVPEGGVGGMGGGFAAVAAGTPPQEDQPEQDPAPPTYRYYFAGGMAGTASPPGAGEPNDSNDTDPNRP